MERSKSEENKNTINTSFQQNNSGLDVKEPDVEKEIQNILISADKKEDNNPCCSWQNSSTKINMTETVQPPLAAANIDPIYDFVTNTSIVPKCNNQPNESVSNIVVNSTPPLTVSSCSLITEGLFHNLESIDDCNSNNAPTVRLSIPPEVPPRSRREIPRVNFPDTSMLQFLHTRQSLLGPPPSYSKSLLDRRINPCASIQFVAPIPPPSYDGMENELRYVNYSGFTLGLGHTWQFQSQPAYCPICETVTITRTEMCISRLAHFSALIMFFLLCWPFCLLPYFLNICNYTFHHCSVCHSYLGARRPFQRNH